MQNFHYISQELVCNYPIANILHLTKKFFKRLHKFLIYLT